MLAPPGVAPPGHGRRFLVPVPKFGGGLGSPNARLEAARRGSLAWQLWGKPAARAELLAEDRAAIFPLPSEGLAAARVEPRRADSLSLVNSNASQHSVPA